MKRIMPLLLILANIALMSVMYVITALSLLAFIGVPLAAARSDALPLSSFPLSDGSLLC